MDSEELRNKRRERRVLYVVFVLFVIVSFAQAFLSESEQSAGFLSNLFYFLLLNLNVVVFGLLAFLVIRNLVKAYVAQKRGGLGMSLRWRIISSLLAFTIIPALLLFVGSSYVVRQGFDRWFNVSVGEALENANEISRVHYEEKTQHLLFFGEKIRVEAERDNRVQQSDLRKWLESYPLQAIEYYPSFVAKPKRVINESIQSWRIPPAAVESLQNALKGDGYRLTRHVSGGDLVQVFIPIYLKDQRSILVLSDVVPLGLKTKIETLNARFEDYLSISQLKGKLKGNYTLILLSMFVLILFVITWFGLYLANSLTAPVLELIKGTQAFREGRYDYRIPVEIPLKAKSLDDSVKADLEVLKSSFNLMADEVGRRGGKLQEANAQLMSLVSDLEERERYLETLLSNIRRGVLVLDTEGKVLRVNSEAFLLSEMASKDPLDQQKLVGLHWTESFSHFAPVEEVEQWLDLIRKQRGKKQDRIFEVSVGRGRSFKLFSVRATGIWLIDEHKKNLGWLIILEDVSDAARLERLAAWQEVARRVAHEIKNPLTPIQISADRMRRQLAEVADNDERLGKIINESLGQINKQIRVIRDLVREFSEFAKLPEPKFEMLNLHSILKDLVADYRFTHSNVKFHFENQLPEESSLMVKVDNEYLRRLFVNLADNAIQSMEEAKVVDPSYKVVIQAASKKDFVHVVFEDNGIGISNEMRDKIFDPYVSSKTSGLGLGLPIVKRIAMEHMGRIWVDDAQQGSGARFILELPLVNQAEDSLISERRSV